MGKDREYEGRTLQEALDLAASSLGIAEPDLDYQILEQGRRGLFGLGARPVRIRVMPPLDEDGNERGGRKRRRSRRRRSGNAPRPETAAPEQGEGSGVRAERSPSAADGASGDDSRQSSEGGRGPGGRRRGGGRGRGRGRGTGGGAGSESAGAAGTAEAEGNVGERGARGSRGGRRRRRRGGRSRGSRDDAPRSAGGRRSRPTETVEAPPEQVEKVLATASGIIRHVGLDVDTHARGVPSGVELDCSGADVERLTADNADLLVALRFVLNRMGRRSWPESGRVTISCDGADREIDEELMELVREVAQQVVHTGQAKKLDPMNAYERRLVHIEVRRIAGVSSESEGDGEIKQVWIRPDDSDDDDLVEEQASDADADSDGDGEAAPRSAIDDGRTGPDRGTVAPTVPEG